MDTILTAVTPKSIAALETGIEESKIRSVAFELDFLRKNGLLIDIHISGVGMFTRSAQLAELGVSKDDEKAQRYTAGSKFLIPKDVIDSLRSVEVRMRLAHQKYAIDVAGFRPYRWLPYTGYQNFKKRWNSLMIEFQAVKKQIIDELDAYRDQLADEFAAGACHTWKAIEGQGYTAMIFNGRGYVEIYSFVDAVVDLALAQFPTAEKIASDLKADYSVGVIYTDYDEQAHQMLLEQAFQKAQAENQAAYLQASILQEQFDNERRMHQLAQQEKELQIEAMMAAEMAHAKDQLEQMRHPFEEVFISLRQEIAEACDRMKASIEKNGFVRGKIAEQAKGLLEFYDLFAVHNDKELRATLVELRTKLSDHQSMTTANNESKALKARSTDEIANILKDLINMANIEAEELADLSRAAFLEV